MDEGGVRRLLVVDPNGGVSGAGALRSPLSAVADDLTAWLAEQCSERVPGCKDGEGHDAGCHQQNQQGDFHEQEDTRLHVSVSFAWATIGLYGSALSARLIWRKRAKLFAPAGSDDIQPKR